MDKKTLRDEFAIAALTAIFSSPDTLKKIFNHANDIKINPDDAVSLAAYNLADSMIKNRSQS